MKWFKGEVIKFQVKTAALKPTEDVVIDEGHGWGNRWEGSKNP